MREIRVVDYDQSWPDMFEKERALLFIVFGTVAIEVYHIGSTAVSGLAAKPIIDLLLEVDDIETLDRKNPEMETIGYESKGEFGIPGRRYFRKGGDQRTHHVHAFQQGDSNIVRHLAFRDYLREHQDIADRYGELKKRIAANCNGDLDRYCDGKDAFVKDIEAAALRTMHTSPANPDENVKI